MTALTISQLARSAGVGVETVRFYQRRGLINDPRPRLRSGTGRRHYGGEDVERLRFIRQAQVAGFSLAEIAELMELDAGSDRARARELARARIADIDTRIAALTEARSRLDALAGACARGEGDGCPIIAAFHGS